jgi:hypothetical protein
MERMISRVSRGSPGILITIILILIPMWGDLIPRAKLTIINLNDQSRLLHGRSDQDDLAMEVLTRKREVVVCSQRAFDSVVTGQTRERL